MKNMKDNKGITLIALVITIIVLLILAGISIATLTGKNGVLTKASIAEEESKKKEYEEILILIANGLRSDKIINNWDNKTYLDEFEKEIPQEERLKDAQLIRKDDETLIVITEENYVYKINENEIKFIGIYDGKKPPDLIDSIVTFKVTPDVLWTNKDVIVEISTIIQGYMIEYSLNGTNWQDYNEPIIMKQNGVIHARLIDAVGIHGGSATKSITIIDKENPRGSLDIISTEEAITINITAEDEQSGIDKIVGKLDDGEEILIDKENKTHTFNNLQTGSTHNISIKIYDLAGNILTLNDTATTKMVKWFVHDGKIIDSTCTLVGQNRGTFQESVDNVRIIIYPGWDYQPAGLYWELDEVRLRSSSCYGVCQKMDRFSTK